MFDLKSLPLGLVERLVVRKLSHQVSDLLSKMFFKLCKCGLGVLDSIVQGCRQQHDVVRYFSVGREHSGNRDRVIDVRGCSCVLTTLVPMLLGCKCDGFQQFSGVQMRKTSLTGMLTLG